MKILELKVEGFRSLKSVTWKPGDLNVVIGPNAGGKSNLLQLLEMIAASARGELAKFVKNQGGMPPLVWDGQAKEIEIRLDTSSSLQSEEANSYTQLLSLAILPKTSMYSIEHDILSLLQDGEEKTLLKRNGSKIQGCSNEGENLETNTAMSYEPALFCSNIINDIAKSYQMYLDSWSIYAGLNTDQDAQVREPFVTSYEKRVDSDGQNFSAVLHTLYTKDKDFRREIDLAMQAAFGEEFEEICFPPASDSRSQFAIRWSSLKTEQSAGNLSDGTLRFLYLLTILAHPEPPALIAIDEPETGLHPSMMSIIAEYAIEAARKTQVIITTHSPEFLGAFRDTQPTTTVCKWHDGQTQLRVLSGDKLDYWLEEYTLGDLFRSGELEGMDK